jgi:hypothetical protein
MNTLIMSVKKMPLTVLLAWLSMLALYAALFLAYPTGAVFVGIAVVFVVSLKRLLDYYMIGR